MRTTQKDREIGMCFGETFDSRVWFDLDYALKEIERLQQCRAQREKIRKLEGAVEALTVAKDAFDGLLKYIRESGCLRGDVTTSALAVYLDRCKADLQKARAA